MRPYANLPIKERIARRRKLKRRRKIIAFLSILLVIVATVVFRYGIPPSDMDKKGYDQEPSGYEGIHEANNSKTASETSKGEKKDINELEKELRAYIAGFKGQYGIYYINLISGEEFGINDTDEYIAASTVKIPLNLFLYKKIKEGSVNPDDTMTYLESDYEGGTGSIQYKSFGTKYTIRELSKLSIEVSDNVATNMLLRLLGRENLKAYMRSLGGIVVDDEKNISCPRDMALYMKKVYEFCEEDSELGRELMGFFENTVFNDRIPKLLPENIKVAHKIGTQVAALHDVGIVYASRPYILAVMSKGIDESQGNDVIANISKKVYDFVTE